MIELSRTRTHPLTSTVIVLIGLALFACGAWAGWVQGRGLGHIANMAGTANSPWTVASLILAALYFFAGVLLAIAGLSLVFSGCRRKRSNLIPGPTLYLLGLCVFGIGIHLLLYGQMLYGVAAIVIGMIIAWWEYAFAIS